MTPATPFRVTCYTVPANRVAIVRGVSLFNATAGAATWLLLLNGQTTLNAIYRGTPIASADVFLDRWWVFNPGDTIYFLGDRANLVCTGFGVLLPGPPT